MKIPVGFRLNSIVPSQFPRLRGLFGVVALAPGVAFGATVYDEATDGDFLDTGTPPTSIGALAAGSNEVHGTTGKDAASNQKDLDYFSFSIPNGLQLSEIRLLDATDPSKGFFGLEAGAQLTLPPSAATAAGLLGWVHYTGTQIGTDLLDDIGASGLGASGFTPPLGSGTYSVWVQDTSVGTFPYAFDFVLTSVPDHGSGVVELGFAFLATASIFARGRFRTA